MTRLRLWWNDDALRTHSRKKALRTRLNLQAMERREVPAALVPTAVTEPSYNGTTDSTVSIFNAETTTPLIPAVTPFAGYRGALVSTAADVKGNGVSDIIVAAQNSGGAVKVISGKTGATLFSFNAFPGFNGTVNVGAADLSGDGYQDILVSANAMNAPIKAFSGKTGALLSSFYAFPGFNGQISVSGGNFNGTVDQIIVGAGGVGANGRVALFNANGTLFNPGFFAFPGFNGAISVAGGDVTGSGVADIVVGAGPGSPGGAIKTVSSIGFTTISSFIPFAPTVTNGVTVTLADGTGSGVRDIFVVPIGGGMTSLGGLEPLVGFNGKTGLTIAQSTGGQGTNSGGDSGSDGDSLGSSF